MNEALTRLLQVAILAPVVAFVTYAIVLMVLDSLRYEPNDSAIDE